MKYLKKVQELVKDEFNDYEILTNPEIHFEEFAGSEFYTLEFNQENINDITIKVIDDKMEVELGEDSFYEFETYLPSVRYLWQALLWQD